MSTPFEPKGSAGGTRPRTRCRHLGLERPVVWAALALLPVAALGATLSVEGGPVVLGRTRTAEVRFHLDAPGEGAPLRLAVNVGSFSDPVPSGPGSYRALYTPPDTRFPQQALVAVWRETGPEAPVEILRIPLHGTSRLTVKAAPGSAVTAKVGSEEFGPAVAGPSGEAVLPIVAGPGARTARVAIAGPRGALSREVALEVPPGNRLVAAVVPARATGDGTAAVRLEAFYDAGGSPVPPARLRVAASEGEPVLREAGGGRYSYHYRAPAAPRAREVRFRFSVDGDPSAAARAVLALAGPTAAAFSASAAPRTSAALVRVAAEPAAPQATAPASPVAGPGFYFGPRVGFVHSLGDLSGARLGLDGWIPLRLGRAVLGLGLSLSRGSAATAVSDPGGTLRTTSSAEFFPAALRFGWQAWSAGRLSFTVGAGYAAAFAVFTSGLGGAESGSGTGPLGFASAAYALGPGQLFVEASAGRIPIATRDFRLEAGGLAVEGGYRLGVF